MHLLAELILKYQCIYNNYLPFIDSRVENYIYHLQLFFINGRSNAGLLVNVR